MGLSATQLNTQCVGLSEQLQRAILDSGYKEEQTFWMSDPAIRSTELPLTIQNLENVLIDMTTD